MQKQTVAAILVATMLGSCIIVFSDKSQDNALNSGHLLEFSNSISTGEFKIHRPGESHHADETLVWYPNNVTGFSTMQFTIILDGSLQTETITQINIIGKIQIAEQQDIEQFNAVMSGLEVQRIEDKIAVVENYSYPNTVWGGNYSITVEILFSSNSEIILERDDIRFSSYGINFGPNTSNAETTLCSCEEKQIEMTLTNTGEDETVISYSLAIDESDQNARISLTEESEEYSTGTLTAGQTLTFAFNILISKDPITKDGMISLPISLSAYYENDDGDLMYLFDGETDTNAVVLDDGVHPRVELSFGSFDFHFDYINGNLPKIPEDVNADLFTFNADFFLFEINISNDGYYDREISLEPTNQNFNYRIIIGDNNSTIGDFNLKKLKISSQDFIICRIMIEDTYGVDLETIGIDVVFNDSFNTMTSFNLRNEPDIFNDVLTHELVNQQITKLPVVLTEYVNISIADYEGHLFFDNEWVLLCSATGLAMVEIPIFDSTCSDSPVEITYAEDSSKLSSIAVEIKLDESYTDESVSVELALLPAALPVTAEAIHELTIQIPINLPNNHNDSQTNNSNNTNNIDNSNNNTNDNNSNNEDNQTDYDLDDDGIPDLVDNCPDTAQGAAVDSYGCTIDEEDNDNTQQGNTGQQQDGENTASKAEESNVLLYSIIGFILATVVIGVFIVKNRGSTKTKNSAMAVAAEPIMPLPVMPLPALEPVVLQQWTDANGYSWRQMSDQTIMWWNGTDWIPYGKN